MLTDIQLLQIKNRINRILHVPGNNTGSILEMAIVADYQMEPEVLREDVRRVVEMLKKQEETFRNVRLNLIKWVSDDCIIKEVVPMPFLLLGRAFEDLPVITDREKTWDELLRQLKLFYARSKVILVFTNDSYRVEDEKAVRSYLQPFLARKLLVLRNGEQINI